MNNFGLIVPLLRFDSDDDFYFVQLHMRKKEHIELGSKSYVIKSYYITSIEHLEERMEEMIKICDMFDARAYINLNRRSFEKLTYQLLKKLSDKILNKDFATICRAYNSVCGEFSNEPNKKWVVDIDGDSGLSPIIDAINNCNPTGYNKIFGIIPTKNGQHIISQPFNIEEFKKSYPNIDIQKNNPTLLYFKDESKGID